MNFYISRIQQFSLGLVLLMFVTFNLCFAQLEIIYPKNNQHFSTSDNIEFKFSGNATVGHEFQLSTEVDFSTILFDTTVFQPVFDKVFLGLNGEFYIRSKYSSESIWSDSQSIFIFDLVNNAEMWLRTDSVDIVNGNVSTWYDMSGNGNHANQTITDAQPNFIAPNDTNIYPAIMMDGENDYFQGDPISSINSSSYNFFHSTLRTISR